MRRLALGALAAAQVAYGLAPARSPRMTRGIVVSMLAVSAVEAVQARGWRRGALPVALGGALGFVSEVAGVATGRPFGAYSYTDRLGRRVAGVPLLAAAAWAMMARPAWVTAGWLTRGRVRRVPVAAAALTAWDLMLDPRMVREDYWVWPQGGRYEGVPASNFAGWFVVGLGVFAGFAVLDGAPAGAEDDGALALYAWIAAGEAFANAALWAQPVTAAVGGTAMGAFAAPALARRVRA
jgi:putative membrane protein